MITSINIYQLNKNKNSIGNKDQNSLNENNNNIIESINDEDTFETLDFDFYQFNADEIKESEKAIKESQKPIKKSKKETKNKNKAVDEEFEFLDPEKELKRKEEQNEPYSQHYQDSMENDNNSNFKMNELHDASQNSSVLKNKNIPENILKLIYNIIYVMKKIKFHNFIESRFLFAVLIKFSLIANYTFDFILKNLNLSIPLNLMMFQLLSEKNYSETIFTIGDSDLHETTHRISNGEFNLESIEKLDTISAREKLLTLSGVGPKVADCILLFSTLKRFDVFPIDVWVRRVMNELYIKNEDETKVSKKEIMNIAKEKFGNLEGLAQQYLFYWKREA